MKKMVAILIFLSMLFCSAIAETTYLSLWASDYNAAASVLGAPAISYERSDILDDQAVYYAGKSLQVRFFLDGEIKCQQAAVLCSDETEHADFLLSCFAVICYMGDVDTNAAGRMLLSYSRLRTGNEAPFFYLGMDAYQMLLTDDGVYQFIYLKNILN
jgi:hypothetical protein